MYVSAEKSQGQQSPLVHQHREFGQNFVDNRSQPLQLIGSSGGTLNIARKVNSKNSQYGVCQRIMMKTGLDQQKLKLAMRSTVYLYAELDGKPIGHNGIFMTSKENHAEENLIKYIYAEDLRGKNLTIWLTTSPCSSTFGTRDDGHSGCQEQLERLANERALNLNAYCDHLYQPADLKSLESADVKGSGGMSSYASASTSRFNIKFHHLPKLMHDEDLLDSSASKVYQLK